jgi:hypothetical protein
MTKKGPLGKAEKFYVDNNLEMSIDSLCKDLDRSKSTIEGYIKSIVIKETTKAETLLYQQFARNNKGSTVMTPNASELSDSKRSQSTKKISRASCVAKIREQNGR